MTDLDATAGDLASLEEEELLGLCRRVALEMNRLHKLQAQIANQIRLASEGSSSQDTLAKRYGCRNSVELIQRLTGESARVVSARIRLGRQTAVRNSLLGEELPPVQEHVANAFESGYLNVDAADHISRVITKNTHASKVDDLEFAERCLVQAATGLDFDTGDTPGMALHADDIRRLCVKWDEALDPDGAAPSDELRFQRRFFNVGSSKDGLAKVTGLITSEVAAAFGAIADSLNNPRAGADGRVPTAESDAAMVCYDNSVMGELVSEDNACVRVQGEAGAGLGDSGSVLGVDPTDDRTPAQRRHDALATALNVALASRELPILQGASATIVVEVREENLTRYFGGQPSDGQPSDGRSGGFGRYGGSGSSIDSGFGSGSGFGSDSGFGSGSSIDSGFGSDSGFASGSGIDSRFGSGSGIDFGPKSGRGFGSGSDSDFDPNPSSGSGGPAWLVGHDGASTPLSISAVEGLSCGAVIQAVVRDSLGRITALGSPARLFSATQRRAIALRDGGCVIPGCTVPASWCEVHHVRPHSFGGPTHTDNGVLLCRFHHSTIDSSGWEITMNQGVPLVGPPTWLKTLYPDDPRRRWMNRVLADQTRRIREKLETRRKQRIRIGAQSFDCANLDVVDPGLVDAVAVNTSSVGTDAVDADIGGNGSVTSCILGADLTDIGAVSSRLVAA